MLIHASVDRVVLTLLLFNFFLIVTNSAHSASARGASNDEQILLYNGHDYVTATRGTSGMYEAIRSQYSVKYLSTHNYSYGNPFIVLDTRNSNVLFDMRSDDGDRNVRFWRIGRDESFVSLSQTGKARLLPRNCSPREKRDGFIIIQVDYEGTDQDGDSYSVREFIPVPQPLCDLDKLNYVTSITSSSEEKRVKFEKDLAESLEALFDIHPGGYSIHSSLLR